MNQLVSVVVPTFNRSKLVVEAAESILAQTYRPIEIIIVDDGSSDDTAMSVDRFVEDKDQNAIIVYLRQENKGGNVARNRGIQEAHGEFVAFLDSDDLWHPDKLKNQISVFSDRAEFGAVYCGVRHIDAETGDVTETASRVYPSGRLLEEMLVKDVTAPTSTYIVRKAVFDKIGGFDESLKARQDWDMWIRVASSYAIGCVPEALVDFRDHAGPRTASNPQREIDAYRLIRKKYASLLEAAPKAVRLKATASYYRRMGRVHLHHSISRPKALGYYTASIVTWPFDFDSYAAFAGFFLPRNFRASLHRGWNRVFGKTPFSIRSH
jgi:glycosyltransferase involved in cell wall biosynthesis